MVDLEWAHAIAAVLGAVCGAAGSIFMGGWRLGRIEARLERKITEAEKRIETKLMEEAQVFDETLKGLRQKINDVEKDGLLRYLPKDEFNDFRQEYRQDMARIFDKLDHPPHGRRSS